jgi:hypothetical protein
MRMLRLGVTVALWVLAAARPATAQGDSKQFYVGLGFAYGQYDLAGNGYSLPSTYQNNIAYYGEIGIRLKGKFGLGFEADYFTKSSSGGSINVWYYSAAAQYYPSAGSNFWLKGLAGYANTSTTFSGFGGGGGGYGSGSASQGGFAMGIGFGYDLHLGAKLALVPFAQYLAQLSGGSFAGSGAKYESRLFMVGGQIALSP